MCWLTMGFYNCLCSSRKKKKKDKGVISSFSYGGNGDNVRTLQVKLGQLHESLEPTEFRLPSFDVPVPCHVHGSSYCKVKVRNGDSPRASGSGEVNYEGGDVQDTPKGKIQENDLDEGEEILLDGENASDPGVGKAGFWGSQKLERSSSDLGMKSTCQELVEQLRIGRSKSYEDMIMLSERYREAVPEDGDKAKATSPVSVMTQRSADKVMLKKHSSSRILPSRSRRLWWKLFMWSHRNVYKSGIAKPHSTAIDPDTNLRGGYCSDTAEPRQQGLDSSRIKFQTSLKRDCNAEDQRWDKFYGVAGMWPQNQWVACPTESSSFARVDEWVKEISVHTPFQPGEDDNGESHALLTARNQQTSIFSEVSHANSVIQSLNASSSVAHMTGIQLKVIPSISRFSSLRSVNLSGNLIAHISPGSLPKGLHVLNLSKNKISTIEGLRDLTRLRVIDLSYNRISRIGRGLSNCTLVKELCLAGNKISMVEGIHRLLKLAVLDLSFNRIATTKAIGQLVANYHSLVALNLLGNPIRTTISEEQLRKTVSCLLPKLALLNKQPIAVLRNHGRGKQGKMGRTHGKNVTTNAATSVQGWKGHSHGRHPSKDRA